ncbi:MAG: S9 family peptidase, partial [Gemmataceae bacterium]|nr:S9 family peptidase [Gemmataceae bacterium]
GLQVYENMRAVDYLRTRPEVDGSKIAITGASGGGNQTMYAGAFDERFGAVVPVCSVGNYQAYLGTACCMCEVVPGALRFTEEGGVLGLTAPRALLVINATKDAIQFSIPEAKKSLAFAERVYKVLNAPDNLRHTTFDWHHDYSQAMREAMYGWLAKHLKGEGDGSPIPDPPMTTEDPESLRCFPGDTRPADWMTIPKLAAREGRRLLSNKKHPADAETWQSQAADLRHALAERVFGGQPLAAPWNASVLVQADDWDMIAIQPEPGITLQAIRVRVGNRPGPRLAVVLDLDGAAKASDSPLAKRLRHEGWDVVTVDLRATGAAAWPTDRIGNASDHNTAQWGLWIGRPLLGQWAFDIRRLLDGLKKIDGITPERIALLGQGPAGIVALAAAAVDGRITDVAAIDSLASFITETPYKGQRMGVIAPGLLREVGDVADLAALCLPRHVVIAGGVLGDGTRLTSERQQQMFVSASHIARVLNSPASLRLVDADVANVLRALRDRQPAAKRGGA